MRDTSRGTCSTQTPPQTSDRGYALDNASLHRSRAIREARLELKEQGIGLWYLPPYTPERNDIARTFRDAKHSPWRSAPTPLPSA